MTTPIQHPDLPLPDYFSKFAANYVNQTGHSTLSILADIITEDIQTHHQCIGKNSIVHDTAAGPGIGAAAILASLAQKDLPKELLVSDIVGAMVTAAQDSLASSPLPKVDCKTLDSQNLTAVPDNYFTHSLDNFSIFTFVNPAAAIRETYRTLRPGGLSVVTCWRRFAPMYIVHAAQRMIRPDLPLMPTPSPEFYEEGYLQKVVEENGFVHKKIKMVEKTLVVSDADNVAGLTALMSGPMMAKAREGYSAEDEAKWVDSVSKSVKSEIDEFGGIKFQAYVLMATK